MPIDSAVIDQDDLDLGDPMEAFAIAAYAVYRYDHPEAGPGVVVVVHGGGNAEPVALWFPIELADSLSTALIAAATDDADTN